MNAHGRPHGDKQKYPPGSVWRHTELGLVEVASLDRLHTEYQVNGFAEEIDHRLRVDGFVPAIVATSNNTGVCDLKPEQTVGRLVWINAEELKDEVKVGDRP